MGAFDTALSLVLKEEGIYSNDAADSGGETVYGISRVYNPSWSGWAKVDSYAALIPAASAHAKAIAADSEITTLVAKFYQSEWTAAQCDKLPVPLCIAYFDCYVNQGQGAAPKLLQEAVGAPVDGVLGPVTIARAAANPEAFELFMAQRILSYTHDKGWPTFGLGWTKRDIQVTMACMKVQA